MITFIKNLVCKCRNETRHAWMLVFISFHFPSDFCCREDLFFSLSLLTMTALLRVISSAFHTHRPLWEPSIFLSWFQISLSVTWYVSSSRYWVLPRTFSLYNKKDLEHKRLTRCSRVFAVAFFFFGKCRNLKIMSNASTAYNETHTHTPYI